MVIKIGWIGIRLNDNYEHRTTNESDKSSTRRVVQKGNICRKHFAHLRNWFIGYYIVEYEQNGEDRAAYGGKLLKNLSKLLKDKKISNIAEGELRRFRQFYIVYHYFIDSFLDSQNEIRGSLPRVFTTSPIRGAVTRELENGEIKIPANKIVTRLSYTHLEQLITIENPLKRAFYEIECINGTWSTRELERQINSLYYERMGMSLDKEKLSELANRNTETIQAVDI